MTEYKVDEFARLERVHPRTVREWIAKGAVEVRRTPGGGIRIVDRRVVIISTRESDQSDRTEP
jgi:DNA-binding transcriptional MerR regulator